MPVKVLKAFNNCFTVDVRLHQHEKGVPVQVMHLRNDIELPIVRHDAVAKELRFHDTHRTGCLRCVIVSYLRR